MKNILFAILSGILLSLAWPAGGFPLLLFFAFVPLLFAEVQVRNSGKKFIKWRILGISYLTFVTWNLFTTYWLYFSTPFGGSFAVLVNSLLMALVFLIYHIVAKRTNFTAASAFFICIWISFEKLHLTWEFSWPWLNLGNGFSAFHNWVQWYEFTGTFGGTLWVLLVNFLLFKTVLLYREYREKGIILLGILKAAALIAVPIAISYGILVNYTPGEETVEAVILQPNINPYTEKYNTTDQRIGELLLKLSAEKVTETTDIVLAPETVFAQGTALPNFKNSIARTFGQQLVQTLPGLNFLSGISFYERFQEASRVGRQSNLIGPNDWYNDYNSAFMLQSGKDPQIYHKSKLVVGVENFPYQNYLKPVLGNIMIDLGGTVAMKTTQEERSVLDLGSGVSTAPIICYESVYGEYVTGYIKNGGNFLSIITNDAWWGDSPGHKQHLSYAKLRAIETRRSVVRSANTGISAFITETGEITKSLPYAERGSLKNEITLNSGETFYVQHGDYIARIAQFLALFLFLFAVVKYKRRRPS